jgi:four helix bundle protein
MFGMAAQARRAATSVPINIAEGAAKRGRKELVRYLDIALGSLAELNVILRLACELDYMPDGETSELEELRQSAAKQVTRLYQVTRAGLGRPDLV